MKRYFLSWVLLACAAGALYAQDPRERHYFYEILEPRHEPKPLVEALPKSGLAKG